jgi:hypothetical protein
MAKPWILIYSEWVTFDSFNSPIFHVLPARDCEKQEVITFAGNPDYYVKLACSQAIPSVLVGDWVFIPDSTMGFGSKTTDTSIATA